MQATLTAIKKSLNVDWDPSVFAVVHIVLIMISYSSSLCACSTQHRSFWTDFVWFQHTDKSRTFWTHFEFSTVNSELRAISTGLCLKIIFSTQNLFFHVSYSLNVAAVVRFKQRLVLSDGADALETIKSQSHSPPSSVTTQQSPKTPKQGGNPGRSGPHSTLLQVLIDGICWNLLFAHWANSERDENAKASDRERERQQFKLLLLAPPRVKDGFLEECLHGCIAWLQLLPSIKHMGLIYPCGPQWWCHKHQAPSGREKRGGREGGECVGGGICHHTMPVSQRTQRMAHNGSSFVLWWTTTKRVLLLYYKDHRKEPHNSDRSRQGSVVILIHVELNSWVIILKAWTLNWLSYE